MSKIINVFNSSSGNNARMGEVMVNSFNIDTSTITATVPETLATGTVQLSAGASGRIDSLTVNGVSMIETTEILATGTVSLDSGASGRIDGLVINSIEMLSNSETVAVGSVELTGGGADTVDGITVNSIEVMSGAETFVDTLANLAILVAANITAHTSSPDYSAVAVGATVNISAGATTGYGPNGFVVVSSTTTIITTDTNFAGGIAANSVPFNTTLDQTATDLAANIQANNPTPNYTAVAVTDTVTITAVAGTGYGPNTFDVTTSVTTIGKTDTDFSGGVATDSVPFNTTLDQTATDLAANIDAFATTPNYSAAAVTDTVTITADVDSGISPNNLVVTSGATTITTVDVNMSGGVNKISALPSKTRQNKADFWVVDQDSANTDEFDLPDDAAIGEVITLWAAGIFELRTETDSDKINNVASKGYQIAAGDLIRCLKVTSDNWMVTSITLEGAASTIVAGIAA